MNDETPDQPRRERACQHRYPGTCAHCTLIRLDTAADRLSRREATIRQWIRRHHLTAYRHNGTTYILEADLLACERDRRHATRDTQKLTTG